MVTAVVVASAVVLGIAVTFLAARFARARSDRRFESVLLRVDGQMEAISKSLQRVVERSTEVHQRRVGELELTLNFAELLEQLVAEAAVQSGAQAVAIRVEGPGKTPVVASVGAEDGAALLEGALGPPDARPYRALTMNWTYGPALEGDADAYSSALVVPIVEEGATTGAIVAYAGGSDAFRPEHMRALRTLVDEAAPGIANARRFAEIEQRSLTDVLTGVRNRRGYEAELEREIARASRTGRPLSLLVVDLDLLLEARTSSDSRDGDVVLKEFADLLSRTARATDILCRRRAREFAVLLPETKASGAHRFYSRIRGETGNRAITHVGHTTFSAGFVEWRPPETGNTLDARASAALGRSAVGVLGTYADAITPTLDDRRDRRRDTDVRREPPLQLGGQDEVLERLAREVVEARRLGHPLALLVIHVDDFPLIAERIGEAAAQQVLTDVATRVDGSVAEDGVICRIQADELAAILPRSTVSDAESVLSVLQASLEMQPPEQIDRLTVSAGITELTTGDDAGGVLGRAEQALWQAKQAGNGTVVVAMTGAGARR